MREILALAVVVLISACGETAVNPSATASTTPTGTASPTDLPSPTPTPTPPPATPAVTGQPAPVLPLTTLPFACRLPADHQDGTTTFIDFPSRAAAASSGHGTFYDATVSRWLPVFKNQVSPDGRRYAYIEGWSAGPPTAPRVHVVDAATSGDMRVVTMPEAQPYFVIDFTNAGVDLGIGFEGRGPGVWRLDPNTGTVTKVSNGLYPPDAKWIGVVDPKDPQPYRSAMSGMAGDNRIDRRDSAGQTTQWFYRPGHWLLWVAFAGDSALLVEAGWSNPNDQSVWGTEYWLVTAPNQAGELAAYGNGMLSAYVDLQNGFGRALADTHGIWIGGGQSLYFVNPSGSILRVYGEPAYPAGSCD